MPNASFANQTRLNNLDVIRGMAVLGIFIMNIQSFAMPAAAYVNPTVYADFSGVNYAVWLVSHLFADAKFMALFSLLFGASTLLFIERTEAKQLDTGRLHFRRMNGLLFFGLLHAYFLWQGDVLFSYAMCGYFLFQFRQLSSMTLLGTGFAALTLGASFILFQQFQISERSAASYNDLLYFWSPTTTQLDEQIAALSGSLQTQFWFRFNNAITQQTEGFLVYTLWRAGGFMLIGMALYKLGLFTGKFPSRQLFGFAVIAIGVGAAISGLGVLYNSHHQWLLDYSAFGGSLFNYVGSIASALGYFAGVLACIQNQYLLKLNAALAAVGRMSLSNYIGQSVIGYVIFTGFGLFGQVERSTQLAIVVLVWLFQLWFSSRWLNRYQHGPLELSWRYLTYGRAFS